MKLRSVELQLPDTAGASAFLIETWGLLDAGTHGGVRYVRGTGDRPYLLGLARSADEGVRSISLSGTEDEVKAAFERASKAGARTSGRIASFDEPGSPSGFVMEGLEGQIYRIVADREPAQALPPSADRPIQITHTVMNVRDRAACTKFAQDVLGFKLSDRTGVMSFLRCNRDHHAFAYADSDVSSLHHMAFEMLNIDAVMKGIGRMRDSGHPAVWGPGRHGPGNNVFGYFVSPFGPVIEYTTEVQQVDDSYRTGSPEDWKWPPGRTDHWGVAGRDGAKMHAAEQRFRFRSFAEAA